MEYGFKKDYLYSIDLRGGLTLIPKSSIRKIEASTAINQDMGIYRVLIEVYLNHFDRISYITIFSKNFKSASEAEENLKIQNKYLLENY